MHYEGDKNYGRKLLSEANEGNEFDTNNNNNNNKQATNNNNPSQQ